MKKTLIKAAAVAVSWFFLKAGAGMALKALFVLNGHEIDCVGNFSAALLLALPISVLGLVSCLISGIGLSLLFPIVIYFSGCTNLDRTDFESLVMPIGMVAALHILVWASYRKLYQKPPLIRVH